MQLKNFERTINKTIMQRGKSYFEQGLVQYLEQVSDTNWQAEVHGNDEYIVDIVIEKQNITYADCDCPYGALCKHIAATLLAIKQQLQQPKSANQKKKPSLQTLLKEQSKEQLIELILTVGKGHREFLRELELELLPAENEADAASNIILHHLTNAQERGGYIPWGKTSKAIKGIELIQERVQHHLNEGNSTVALELAILCLQGSLDALECGDDSSGDLSGAAEYSIELMDQIIEDNNWNTAEKMETLHEVEDVIFNVALEQWTQWQIDLLRACVPLCEDAACKQEFFSMVENLKAKHTSGWDKQYIEQQIDILLKELKTAEMTLAETEQYLKVNPLEHDLRNQLIDTALHDEDFLKVLELIEQAPTATPWFNSKWQKDAYKAHKRLGHVDKMKQLATDIALSGNLEYYYILKEMYTTEEWPTYREPILNALKSKRWLVYEELIVDEQQYERILEYCQQHPIVIRKHYPHLVGRYDEQVIDIFTTAITSEVASANSRNQYQEVAALVYKMKLAGYTEQAQALVEKLKALYSRRRALIEELNKI